MSIECADCGCFYDPDDEQPEHHSPACPIRKERWDQQMPNPNIAVQYREDTKRSESSGGR